MATYKKTYQKKEPIHVVMQGRWGYFFADKFPDLKQAMDASPDQVPCPVCGGKTRFKLFKDWQSTGGGMCQRCGTFPGGYFLTEHLMGDAKAASRELRDWLKAEGVQTPTAQVVRKPIVDEVKDVASARVSNKKLWDESFPLTEDCPPMKYLRARGITMPLSQFPSANVMRWHPNAVYRKEKDEEGHTYSRFPALISKVVRNGKTVALHRIYVTKDGLAKADVKRPKKLTAASSTHISGCAIPLYTPKNGILGVCEGVETGLAIRQLFGHSIWPCISDSFMAAVEWDLVIEAVSASGAAVKELHVFVDLDRNKAGQKAGDKLKERGKAAGVKVIIHLPKGTIPADAKGIDFLDNLVSPTK